jgi:hypothetical protein
LGQGGGGGQQAGDGGGEKKGGKAGGHWKLHCERHPHRAGHDDGPARIGERHAPPVNDRRRSSGDKTRDKTGDAS